MDLSYENIYNMISYGRNSIDIYLSNKIINQTNIINNDMATQTDIIYNDVSTQTDNILN
jgi:hypothetical protein